tara:strand:- start:37772 stop:38905 length:1134 start_codon:yes stop_codon:yes gene_type:complete
MLLLLKGFEVELFTGLPNGEHVGIAASATNDLPGFVKEPDQRNIEFITAPNKNYSILKEALITPRVLLREWLALHNLTILPGSTLNLGCSRSFERSDDSNPYHELIEKNYGTKVVTTSVHINLGIEKLSNLFSVLRLARCEASLFLALSASSPFLYGLPAGAHSQRWIQFPKTPKEVPLFLNHEHYVNWILNQLSNGTMWNERHFWSSVRPNGPSRPHDLNRLEFRICDLITDCDLLLAITALLELRVLSLINQSEQFDPLIVSKLNTSELESLSDLNDMAAAKDSLDAPLHDWRNGKPIICRDWIEQILNDVAPLACDLGMKELLLPIYSVLDKGNQAMRWLQSYEEGASVNELIQQSIVAMEDEETASYSKKVIL